MSFSREIGWGTEVNLLHAIGRKLDKIVEPCCTTTTTTQEPTTTTTTTEEGLR